MRTRVAGALLLALFFACGVDDPGAPTNAGSDSGVGGDGAQSQSDATTSDGGTTINPELVERGGMRLKLTTYVGDGVRVHGEIYDSELGFECRFYVASTDGVTRCLPRPVSADVFADANCSQRLAIYHECETKPQYARVAASAVTCEPQPTKFFPIGVDVPSPTLFYETQNGCQPYGPAAPDFRYAAVGPEVPPSTFVEVTSKSVHVAPNLDVLFYESADGLHALAGMRVPSHGGVSCSFESAEGSMRCLPQGLAVGNMRGDFTSAQCTTELANSNCSTFALARRFATSCPSQTRIYHVGDAYTGDAGGGFRKASGSCVAQALPSLSFRVVGAEVPVTEFAEGVVVPSTATTRLRADRLRLPDGSTVALFVGRTTAAFDTVKGTSCSQSVGPDGKLRCFPNSASSSEFLDDACTIPIARVWKGTCDVPKFYKAVRGTGCSARRAYGPLLGKRATTTVYARATENAPCTSRDVPEYDVYDVGPELPETEWAELATERL